MLNQKLSDRLWAILKGRAASNRLYSLTAVPADIAVTVEAFTVKRKLKNGRVSIRRSYYRIVRTGTGALLYDGLEGIDSRFVDQMAEGKTLVPDLQVSPDKSNKILSAVLKQQAEVDKLIEEARV